MFAVSTYRAFIHRYSPANRCPSNSAPILGKRTRRYSARLTTKSSSIPSPLLSNRKWIATFFTNENLFFFNLKRVFFLAAFRRAISLAAPSPDKFNPADRTHTFLNFNWSGCQLSAPCNPLAVVGTEFSRRFSTRSDREWKMTNRALNCHRVLNFILRAFGSSHSFILLNIVEKGNN